MAHLTIEREARIPETRLREEIRSEAPARRTPVALDAVEPETRRLVDAASASVLRSPTPRTLLAATLGERVPRPFLLRPEVGALLAAHRAEHIESGGEKLHFAGVGDKAVYNPSAPFTIGSGASAREIIAARVESTHLETDSEVVFFEKVGATWLPAPGLFRGLHLQDPCVTVIDGKLIVGGVRVFEKPKLADGRDGGLGWETVFYRSHDGLHSFESDQTGKPVPILTGPLGMKDIRLKQLRDGRIAVFTRPQGDLALGLGAAGTHGSVGFTVVSNLRRVTADVIAKAPLIEAQFPADQWWGVNEAHQLADGTLAVFGHAAMRFPAPPGGGDPRGYYALEFRLNTETRRVTDMKMLAERKDFAPGPSKRPELANIIFTGGIRHGVLYVGAGDQEAHARPVKSALLP